MTLIEELDRIIAFAIPISDTDCKRVISKKEWRREETKGKLIELMEQHGAMIKMITLAENRVRQTIEGPNLAVVGDNNGPEYAAIWEPDTVFMGELKNEDIKLTNIPGINKEIVIPSSPNIIKENSSNINKK